jgi:hypothetical protein
LSFVHIFLAEGAVLYLLYRVRAQIYTEAYLTMSVWAFLFILLEQFLLHFIGSPDPLRTLVPLSVPLILGGFLSAGLSVPLFMLLDGLSDRWGMRMDAGSGFRKGRILP